MAIASTTLWGKLKGYLWEMFKERVKIRRVSITGFTNYATNGVTFNVLTANNYSNTADTQVILEADATHSFVYDKANGKIIFVVNSTGAELTNSADISTKVIYGTIIGR